MEELVEHHVSDGVALELDDDAQALAIGLVAQLGDALEPLLTHHLSDALDHARLVDLKRQIADDDRLAVFAHLLNGGAPAHRDRAAPKVIGRTHARRAEDDAAGGKIGRRNKHHELVDGDTGIVDVSAAGVDHLAQIVRRNVGCHADGDAAGTVDQQVREPGRQGDRLLGAVVVVGLEIDGIAIDVLEQRVRRAGHAHLGVAHRRGRVAVHRAEVALAVDQQQAHREVLGHAHHGVVDRGVAVRVVLTHHVANHPRRFPVRPVRAVARLVHAIEDAPVHRLETIAHVGQCARHDHAHRVIEVGAFHLLLDGDGRDVELRRCCGVGH